jgi:hypothetical protein
MRLSPQSANIYESLFSRAQNKNEDFPRLTLCKMPGKFLCQSLSFSLVMHWLLWLSRALLRKRYESEKRSFIRQTTLSFVIESRERTGVDGKILSENLLSRKLVNELYSIAISGYFLSLTFAP